jgi:uncharacterized membrane protein YphA (DoxX/SURF4 family)
LKKAFIIAAILFLILLIMIGYNQYMINESGGTESPFGEVFGYLYYVIIAAGIIGVIWLLLKPAKKKD